MNWCDCEFLGSMKHRNMIFIWFHWASTKTSINSPMSHDNTYALRHCSFCLRGAYLDSPYAIGLRKLTRLRVSLTQAPCDTTPSTHINGGLGRCSFGSSSHYMKDMKYHDKRWLDVLFVYAMIIETSYAYVILCILPRKNKHGTWTSPHSKKKQIIFQTFISGFNMLILCGCICTLLTWISTTTYMWHHMNQNKNLSAIDRGTGVITDFPAINALGLTDPGEGETTPDKVPGCPGPNSTLWKS